MQIETIRELVRSNRMIWTKHVKERIRQRGITKEEVIKGILGGEIIEKYPNDYPFPSCLIWAKFADNKIIHVVVGYNGNSIYVISVYIPDETKFKENFKVRRDN